MRFTLVVLVALSLTLTWQASVTAEGKPDTCWAGETQTDFASRTLVMKQDGRIKSDAARLVSCDQ